MFFLALTAWLPCRGQQDTTMADESGPETYKYVLAGLGIGTKLNPGFFISADIKQNFSVGLHIMETSEMAAALPEGFRTGWCFAGDCTPKDSRLYYSLYAGKYFSLNSQKIRWGLQGGPTLVMTGRTVFTAIENTGWFGRNYEVSNKRSSEPGAFFKALADWRLSKTIWLEPSLSAHVSSAKPVLAANLYLNCWLFRKGIKNNTASK